MRAGKLGRSLSIERMSKTVTATGDVVTAWSVVATVRAELLQGGTSETSEGYGEADTDSRTFRIRYLSGITGADQVKVEGRAYGITGITEIGRRRALEIKAVAKI